MEMELENIGVHPSVFKHNIDSPNELLKQNLEKKCIVTQVKEQKQWEIYGNATFVIHFHKSVPHSKIVYFCHQTLCKNTEIPCSSFCPFPSSFLFFSFLFAHFSLTLAVCASFFFPLLPPQSPRAGPGNLSQLIRRHFSDKVRSTFFDKSEVTDWVLCLVKNFQKVDPSKLDLPHPKC